MLRYVTIGEVRAGDRVMAVGDYGDALRVEIPPTTVMEVYAPFGLRTLVGLTLEDGRVIRAAPGVTVGLLADIETEG